MRKKNSPKVFSPEDLAYISTLNECERRQFKTMRALHLHEQGFSYGKISKIMRTSTHTLQKGIQGLRTRTGPGKGRVHCPGGGRKALLPQHPKWVEQVKEIIEPFTTGLPQDENVTWVKLTVPQIVSEMDKKGYKISEYFIRQILNGIRFRHSSFLKDLPMRDVKDRDAQFIKIAEISMVCKEHGIYDTVRDEGYLTIRISHDTYRFVCDNIKRVWREHLQEKYPQAHTIAILCDGGGSNSSRHHIVKQNLMDLANETGMNFLVMHYPPYCSKYNPIEHRFLSQIHRSWNEALLLSVEDAAQRAVRTTTSKGLTVHVDINNKNYDIGRSFDASYKRSLPWQIVKAPELPQWNYLIKTVI